MTDNPFRALWERGFRRLVPVIPPDAPVHPKSRIALRAKKPGGDARGKVPGVKDGDYWRGLDLVRMESTEDDLDVWNAMGASVGVKLGQGLMALDIDTMHKPTAERVYRIAQETLGNPKFVRFGNAPKCLMLYRCPEDTGYKQLRFSTADEADARVEILTEGRQFVAHGIHPKTGKPYRWNREIPVFDSLTHVGREEIGAFMSACAKELDAKAHSASDDPDRQVDQSSLKAPSWEALADIVRAIPNNDVHFPTRDHYIAMAYGIKGAAPDGYELEAKQLYLDWCDRWDRLGLDPKTDDERDADDSNWDRAKPPVRIGWSWLQESAANAFFQPVSDADQAADNMFAGHDTPKTVDTFELLSIADIRNFPDPEFLADRYIPKNALGFFYSEPGVGKSFMLLDLTLHVAFGFHTWHGDALHAREGAKVLYIAREGVAGFKQRISAWMEHHGLATDDPRQANFHLIRQSMSFMSHDDIRKLVNTVRAQGVTFDLIIVDTVSRVLPGADENLQKEMTLFIRACDTLQDITGATVIGAHHASKAGQMRGSSVLKGAGDFVFKLEKKPGSPYLRMFCEKQKDAPDGWQESYRLETVESEDGASLVPVRVEDNEPDKATCPAALQSMIFSAIEAAWKNGTPWSVAPQAKERYAVRIMARDFDLRAETAQQWVELWQELGLLVTDVRDRGTKMTGLRVACTEAEGGTIFD